MKNRMGLSPLAHLVAIMKNCSAAVILIALFEKEFPEIKTKTEIWKRMLSD